MIRLMKRAKRQYYVMACTCCTLFCVGLIYRFIRNV